MLRSDKNRAPTMRLCATEGAAASARDLRRLAAQQIGGCRMAPCRAAARPAVRRRLALTAAAQEARSSPPDNAQLLHRALGR